MLMPVSQIRRIDGALETLDPERRCDSDEWDLSDGVEIGESGLEE
jgi:hypothetical protein